MPNVKAQMPKGNPNALMTNYVRRFFQGNNMRNVGMSGNEFQSGLDIYHLTLI